jgi:hypothetical protein
VRVGAATGSTRPRLRYPEGMSSRLFVLMLVLMTAVAAACGSGNNGSAFVPGGGDASVGDGGIGDGGFGDAPLLGGDGGTGQGTLAISPQNPSITIKNGSVPTQAFTTTLTENGVAKTVTSSFSLTDYTVGNITGAGTFTPQGAIGGTATVVAMFGNAKATTTVTVTVDISAQLGDVTLPDGTTIPQSSTGISSGDQTALQAAPTGGDGGTASTLVYPYDQTVLPLGLLAPVVQFAPGSVTPVDFKLSLDTTDFHWDGYGHIGNPAQLQGAIPQVVWNGALASAQPSAANQNKAVVVLSLIVANGGVAYGPAQAHLIIAPGQLTGIIYYESYSSDALEDGGTDFGLWAVKPGLSQPPSHLQPGCVICHGVAASGNTITMGTDDPTVGQLTGVYRIETDGGYTQLATAPPNLPYPITSIDSRGLGWGTVSPDGQVILRGLDQFWGGETLLAWATPQAPLLSAGTVQPLTTTMMVNGDFNMYAPEYSVDGNHLVYVNAPNTGGVGSPGTASESIGVVDIATTLSDGGGGNFGTVTLSNPQTIYDSTVDDAGTGAGAFTKVPTFLPDSKSIVFQETQSQAQQGYNGMLPDWIDGNSYVDGELAMLQPTGSGGYVRVPLTNANTGSSPTYSTQNYEPKPLPVQVGGYYWVVFASFRNDAYPLLGVAKKLWVTAISPGATPGTDASHPPFTLVNQAIVAPQESQRAYWALAPCQAVGVTCQTDDDCCNGSCQPQTPGDPSSPLVCGTPTTGCVANGARCTAGQNQQCCNASMGVQCIGTLNGYGTCNAPGAQ